MRTAIWLIAYYLYLHTAQLLIEEIHTTGLAHILCGIFSAFSLIICFYLDIDEFLNARKKN